MVKEDSLLEEQLRLAKTLIPAFIENKAKLGCNTDSDYRLGRDSINQAIDSAIYAAGYFVARQEGLRESVNKYTLPDGSKEGVTRESK